jgi:hypothetical protein
MTLASRSTSTAFCMIRSCGNSGIAPLLVLTSIFFLAGTNSAHAYLDPGVGSMLLQVILGGVAGAAVLFKLYWARLLTAFGIRRQQADVQSLTRSPSSEPMKK